MYISGSINKVLKLMSVTRMLGELGLKSVATVVIGNYSRVSVVRDRRQSSKS